MTHVRGDAHDERRWWAVIAVVTLLSLALRLAGLGEKSLWLDEAFSVHLARQDAGSFWGELARREANGALHSILLRGWLVLGESEAAVRGLSVAAGAATVPLVAALGRRLSGSRAGFVAALLLAVHASHVRYSQTARGYALAILLVTLATLLFARAVDRPSGGRWAAYAVAAALSLYAHFFAALVLVAHVASLPLLPSRTGVIRGFSRALVGVGALATPLALFVVFRPGGQIDWVGPPGPYDVAFAVWALAGAGPELIVYAGLGALGAAAAVSTLRRRGRSPASWRVGLPLVWLVLPFGLAMLVSAWKPVFVERYLSVSLPALVLVATAGLERLRSRALLTATLAATVLLSACGLALLHRPALAPELLRLAGLQATASVRRVEAAVNRRTGGAATLGEMLRDYLRREDWRAAATHVLGAARRGDAVVFVPPYVRRPFDYYRRRLGRETGPPVAVFPSAGYSERWPAPELPERLGARYARVWVVLSHEQTTERDRDAARWLVAESLPRLYDRAVIFRFAGIRVHLFEGRPERGR